MEEHPLDKVDLDDRILSGITSDDLRKVMMVGRGLIIQNNLQMKIYLSVG